MLIFLFCADNSFLKSDRENWLHSSKCRIRSCLCHRLSDRYYHSHHQECGYFLEQRKVNAHGKTIMCLSGEQVGCRDLPIRASSPGLAVCQRHCTYERNETNLGSNAIEWIDSTLKALRFILLQSSADTVIVVIVYPFNDVIMSILTENFYQ